MMERNVCGDIMICVEQWLESKSPQFLHGMRKRELHNLALDP